MNTRTSDNPPFHWNRRSYYDNQSNQPNGPDENDNLQTNTFKSETSVNVSDKVLKHERDDFDDLVDLTHRAPRKLFKKEQNNANRNSDKSVKKSTSSLPPLPPLPYSFVRLEKAKPNHANDRTNIFNSSSTSSIKSTSSLKQSTTRLIIPLNNKTNSTMEINELSRQMNDFNTINNEKENKANVNVSRGTQNRTPSENNLKKMVTRPVQVNCNSSTCSNSSSCSSSSSSSSARVSSSSSSSKSKEFEDGKKQGNKLGDVNQEWDQVFYLISFNLK